MAWASTTWFLLMLLIVHFNDVWPRRRDSDDFLTYKSFNERRVNIVGSINYWSGSHLGKYTNTHTYTHAHIHVHTHIHAHMDTHIYTYTHAHITLISISIYNAYMYAHIILTHTSIPKYYIPCISLSFISISSISISIYLCIYLHTYTYTNMIHLWVGREFLNILYFKTYKLLTLT